MEENFNPDTTYPRHPTAHTKGGVHLKEQAAKIKDVGLSILKTMGVKIKEEGVFDVLRISAPAVICYHKTYLQLVAGDYCYTKFLNKAAAATDPLERMKWVVCFFLSGIYVNSATMQNASPLNPILGESYYAEKSDGTTLYCEQISHHPPVTAYLMVGPNKSYTLYGTGELDVKMNGFNNIIGKRIGKTTIQFPDGGKIVYTNPDTRIDGLLMGDRRYSYIKTSVFLDKVNKISAEVTFLYEDVGTIGKLSNKLKGWLGAKSDKLPCDHFEVVFFKYEKQQDGEPKKEVLCEGTGSWLSHIQIDGKLLWKIDEKPENDPWIEDMKRRLPSDSIFREDAKNIKIKNFDVAQKEKEINENRQRADAKLRKEFKEKQKQ